MVRHVVDHRLRPQIRRVLVVPQLAMQLPWYDCEYQSMSRWQFRKACRQKARERELSASSANQDTLTQVKSLEPLPEKSAKAGNRMSVGTQSEMGLDIKLPNFLPLYNPTDAEVGVQTDEPEDDRNDVTVTVLLPQADRLGYGWVDELDLQTDRVTANQLLPQAALHGAATTTTVATQTEGVLQNVAAQTNTTSVGTGIEHDWFLALVQYGDVARVKYDVSVCGCRHASLDRESFTVRGGDHDLIHLLRGETGIVHAETLVPRVRHSLRSQNVL